MASCHSIDFNTLIPDEREKGETQLKQCQLVMLRMLKILDHLCAKHSIKYFLTGGTLLGAIRHQGFIPWDDDLDVGMTRENYEKFVQHAVPELPDDIFFQNDETDPFYPSCHVVEARLRDRYSSYVRKTNVRWQDGLMIDISVYDGAYLPNRYFIYFLNKILTVFRYFKPEGSRKRAIILKCISKYVPLPLVYDSSLVDAISKARSGEFFLKKNELSKLIRIKFEDADSWIPIGYDTFLTRQYGDYINDNRPRQHGIDTPKPFTPCHHSEVLHWKCK